LTKPSTIAIDGPVAAGKSVVGKLLSQHLGYRFVDTGAMYRAVTWAALRENLDLNDEQALTDLVRRIKIRIDPQTVNDGRPYTVLVDSQDVTWEIRSAEVEASVSLVSRVRGVREAMVEHQRALARGGKVVMVGRDIGTVVLPNADLKIFLLASPQERARRRYLELVGYGRKVSYEEVLDEILRRDRIDSERAISPLRPSPDAVVLDTDGLSIEEVIARIESIIAQRDP